MKVYFSSFNLESGKNFKVCYTFFFFYLPKIFRLFSDFFRQLYSYNNGVFGNKRAYLEVEKKNIWKLVEKCSSVGRR